MLLVCLLEEGSRSLFVVSTRSQKTVYVWGAWRLLESRMNIPHIGLPSILRVKTDEESQRQTYGEKERDPALRSVSFNELTILEFAVIVGDNPACFRGPSLSMSRKHFSKVSMLLNEFEEMRPPRRCAKEMVMPVATRQEILRQAGYARKEIIELTKPANIVRAQRRKTKASLSFSPIHELSENSRRKALNLLSCGARKRRERELMKAYRRALGESEVKPVDVATKRDSASTE